MFLSEVRKEGTPNVVVCWASTFGPVFDNPYTAATSGQQEFTGLTKPGEAKYKEYLNIVKEARKSKPKRAFEKAFLTWFQAQSDIQCDTYEEDVQRRKRNTPNEGIAVDDSEDDAWDDSVLYPNEVHDPTDDEDDEEN